MAYPYNSYQNLMYQQPYPYYQPYQYQQPMPYQQPVQQTQQPQNGGFVQIRSFDEVRNWPIAPGNTVTFIDEARTHMYTKTASYNQLEAPSIVSYLVMREDAPQSDADGQRDTDIPYASKDDVAALAGVVRDVNNTVMSMKDEVDKMSGTLYGIAGAKKKPAVKKDADEE